MIRQKRWKIETNISTITTFPSNFFLSRKKLCLKNSRGRDLSGWAFLSSEYTNIAFQNSTKLHRTNETFLRRLFSREGKLIGELSHSGRKKRRIERWKYIASKYLHWKARSVRGVHKAKCEKLRRRRKSEKGKVSSYVFPWRDFYGKCSEIDEIHRWLFPFHPVDATALLHAETNSSTRFIEKRGVGWTARLVWIRSS